jgi:hypothetical protein
MNVNFVHIEVGEVNKVHIKKTPRPEAIRDAAVICKSLPATT